MNKLFKKCIAIFVLCTTILCLSACSPKTAPSDTMDAISASVIEIEKYGHAVLDITTADFTAAGYELGDVVSVRFDSYEAHMPFYNGYYCNPGDVMLRGLAPEKNIAICINYGDFSKENNLAVGDTVEIALVEKAGMLAYQELCALSYSNDPADYPDDVTFTNFRVVTVGRIGDGKLYRTASPVNNENGRAGYANDLIAAANVATVMNLADSVEEIEEYCAAEDFTSDYYLALYEDGKVIALDLSANFYSDSFAASVAKGLTFMAENEAPYCIHCTEGKDRAGFAAMLLEALMGASLEEIIDDYMLSFSNYYGVDKATQPERYEAVLNNNLIAMLCHVTGAETREQLAQVDLEAAVIEYLINAGMTEADIHTLQEKLD